MGFFSKAPTTHAPPPRAQTTPPISPSLSPDSRRRETLPKQWRRDNRDEEEDAPVRRTCCAKFAMCVLCLILIGVAGGLIIWHFLSSNNRALVKEGIGVAGSKPLSLPGYTSASTIPTYQFNQCAPNNTANCCNGVDTICDFRVNEILFASLHNGQSSEDEGFLVVGNQEFKFELAFQAGFRGMKVEMAMCNGELWMIHGVCSMGHRDPYTAFHDITTFLENNPREVLIIQLEFFEIAGVPVSLEHVYNVMQNASLTDYLYIKPNPAAYWPTLRDLINNNTRLLLFYYGAQPCTSQTPCPTGFYEWFYYGAETQYNFPTIESLNNISYSCNITRGYGGYEDFFAINNFITDILPSKPDAEIINQKAFVEKHMHECDKFNNLSTSIIFVDFWNYGNLVEIQQEYNIALGNGSVVAKRKALRRLNEALVKTQQYSKPREISS